RSIGGKIAGAEFFNEPTFASMGGAPKGYDAAAYGRDFKLFRDFLRKEAPETKLLGPDSVGEGRPLTQQVGSVKLIRSEDMLAAEGPGLDVFAYHFYGGVSQRCGGGLGPKGVTEKNAVEHGLSAEWLKATGDDASFYAGLRDKFEPGKPLWLTETAETACGGNPWASSFLDSFRYLNQLGLLAQRGVQVVMHNTLAASDYGLVDEATLAPRPNYWAALLWRRLMGTRVLDAPAPAAPNLYIYAHCLRGQRGGVALLALNANRNEARAIELPRSSERYTLTTADLAGTAVELNGAALALTADGILPAITGARTEAGSQTLAPASITFFAIPGAKNAACR
ncbi:MAG: hypothetical protein WCE75_15845, partial [Terracidiphilus sp.]